MNNSQQSPPPGLTQGQKFLQKPSGDEKAETSKQKSSGIPDSGTRSCFGTGAVRDASKGKGIPSMIPPSAIRRVALRFEVVEHSDEGGVKWECY